MIDLLFSPEGRINRARFWLGGIGATIGLGVVMGGLLVALWQVMPGTLSKDGGFAVEGVTALPYFAVVLGYLGLQFWCGICLGIKRYHDMDKPGTRMLLLLIPVIGGLIYLVQAGFGRGTFGPNRYGPDPLTI